MDVNKENTLFNQSFIELFEIAQEGLIVSDENYNLLKLNNVAKSIFGLQLDSKHQINLRHQWRQPLSIINSSVLLLKVKIDFETVTPEDFNENFEAISNNVEYLSKTLDQLSRYTHHFDFNNESWKGCKTTIKLPLK
ncbi:MAG: hypothetical protein IE909_02035 [Campylobacterales bacterium]|nr:hypothetical protein [Campylobacterales bacterium]